MIRIFAFLVGLFFTGWLFVSFLIGAYAFVTEPAQENIEHAFHKHPEQVGFSSDGPFGQWDLAELQRGFKVYREVCSACHSLRHVAFGDLEALGYSEAQAQAIAASFEVPSINKDTGEADTRPGVLADKFPSPYPNATAARAANNNALPPDLSLITKARHDGSNYVYSLLTGYRDPATYRNDDGEPLPEAHQPGTGLYFNPYFANLNLAMAPPLADGQVTFDDGAPNTVKAMSKDVAAFLTWTAEPKMIERKALGLATLIFLLIATGLAYMSYKHVWADAKRKKTVA